MTDHEKNRRQYVSDFIKSKKGSAAVANETGLNKQTLWQLQKMRNGASDPIVEALDSFYDDFDITKASKYGQSEEIQLTSNWLATTPAGATDETIRLRYENQYLKAQVTALTSELSSIKAQFQELNRSFQELAKLGFLGSDSHTTASYDNNQNRVTEEMPKRRPGFYQQKDDQPTDRFRPGVRASAPNRFAASRFRCK